MNETNEKINPGYERKPRLRFAFARCGCVIRQNLCKNFFCLKKLAEWHENANLATFAVFLLASVADNLKMNFGIAEKAFNQSLLNFNSADFYNRGIMHKSFGYEKYNCVKDFGVTGIEAELDSNMIKSDAIYDKMTEKTPFFASQSAFWGRFQVRIL